MNYYFEVLKKYADFSGRARRKEYWMFILINLIITLVLNFLLPAILPNAIILSVLYRLAVLLPSIAVGVRRMHDVGKSGWYVLIPFYNLILACTEGDYGTNDYGADPKSDFSEMDEIGVIQE